MIQRWLVHAKSHVIVFLSRDSLADSIWLCCKGHVEMRQLRAEQWLQIKIGLIERKSKMEGTGDLKHVNIETLTV